MSELILPTIGAVVAIFGLTLILYPSGKRKRTEKPKCGHTGCVICGSQEPIKRPPLPDGGHTLRVCDICAEPEAYHTVLSGLEGIG